MPEVCGTRRLLLCPLARTRFIFHAGHPAPLRLWHAMPSMHEHCFFALHQASRAELRALHEDMPCPLRATTFHVATQAPFRQGSSRLALDRLWRLLGRCSRL